MSDAANTTSQDDAETARKEIGDALANNDTARAREIARQAVAQWPRHHGLRTLEAEVLHRDGDTAAAIEAYLRLGREAADGFWSLLRAVRHLRDEGDLTRARAIFAEEIWPSAAPEDAKLRALAWLATAADDSDETATFYATLATAPPPAPAGEVLARLAALRARQGHEAAARDALAEAGKRGALPLRARAVEADLMLAEGRADELLPLAAALAAEEPDKVEHARRLISARYMAGHVDQARQLLFEALQRWPGDWILLGRLNTLMLDRAELAPLVDLVAERAASTALPEISRFQLALSQLTLGRTDAAMALLNGIADDGATGAMAVPLRRVLALMPHDAWRERSRLADDRAAEVQVVKVAQARTTLMVFGSATGGHSHLPFGYFDALLADYPAHRIYVRDARGRGFLSGMRCFGETEAGTAEGLAGVVGELGASALVTLGSSVAGHAAARFGAALGARSAVLLASPTSFGGEPISGERASPYNRLHVTRRMARTLFDDATDGDLLPLLSRQQSMRSYYYYGIGTERGERNAARLVDIASVTLRPTADTTHAALPLSIIPTDTWRRLLQEDLGLSPRG